MLVLSRRKDETIMIGDDVEITVVDVRGDTVRLGIKAPRSVSVHRKEIYDAIQAENIVAAQGTAPDKTAVGGLGDLLKAGGGAEAVTPAALGKLAGLAALTAGTAGPAGATAPAKVKTRASGLDKLLTKGKTVRVNRDAKP